MRRILEFFGLRKPEPPSCDALDQLETCLAQIATLPASERDRVLRGFAKAIAAESFSMSEVLASDRSALGR